MPRLVTSLAAGLLALGTFAGAAQASSLLLRVEPGGPAMFAQHPWHLRGNPNVTPSNPMGVVGWDGPPADSPSVIGDAGPTPPASIGNAPFEGYRFF